MSTITFATLAAKTPARAAAADTVRARLRGILDGLRVELDAAKGEPEAATAEGAAHLAACEARWSYLADLLSTETSAEWWATAADTALSRGDAATDAVTEHVMYGDHLSLVAASAPAIRNAPRYLPR